MSPPSQRDRDLMRAAVELSRSALGSTSPNPPVGAVVLDASGAVVGQGWTRPPGGPHAEVVALAEAGERARGGTAVVTLEPCRHRGRTGPCTEALLAAGVRRVVVACADPTPAAAGGAQVLRDAGVDVETGVLVDEVALGPLEAWLTSRRTGRPFVTWKLAASIDGRSAAADGTSKWITGEASRADVHRLRGEADAVVAGVGTVLADDPLLDVRSPGGEAPGVREQPVRQPLRVVVDTAGRTPLDARVLAGPSPALLVHGPLAVPAAVPPATARRREVATGPDGRVDLRALLAVLQDEHDVVSVLLEGGPTLAGAFVRDGLVDRVIAYVAPALLGSGRAALGDAGVGTISDAHRLQIDDVVRTGEDVRVTLRPRV